MKRERDIDYIRYKILRLREGFGEIGHVRREREKERERERERERKIHL